ncbi:MAG: hypothetical protein OEU36_19145 [Gammaproteobacteria bacterium]|nr:hypothetical protein [Gammaproteobacteria bacterium]
MPATEQPLPKDKHVPPIECHNLWEIFGEGTEEALRAVQQRGTLQDGSTGA